jgi:hypothetical protein
MKEQVGGGWVQVKIAMLDSTWSFLLCGREFELFLRILSNEEEVERCAGQCFLWLMCFLLDVHMQEARFMFIAVWNGFMTQKKTSWGGWNVE